MAVEHLRLRRISLLCVLILLVVGVVAVSAISQCGTFVIIGMSIIALILFFNISRVIYPVRRILREAAEADEGLEEKKPKEKEGA